MLHGVIIRLQMDLQIVGESRVPDCSPFRLLAARGNPCQPLLLAMASYYETAQPLAAIEDTGQPLAAIEDNGQPLAAIEELLEASHAGTTWHLILNNTTSTRPKDCGGHLFRSLTEQKNFQQTGSTWSCTIHMPCSFARGDGLSFSVTTSAETEKKADDAACRSALAETCSSAMHPL